MYTIFVILIAVALALGIYGVVVQRGAQVVKLDRKMTFMAIAGGGISLAAACAGYCIGRWLLTGDISGHSVFWVHVLSGVLLAAIGIRMLVSAFRSKNCVEHRMENIDMRHDVMLFLRLCINAFIAGVACGILEFSLLAVVLAFFCAAAVFTAVGYISGRAFGGGPSSKAYLIGGIILCMMSILLQF